MAQTLYTLSVYKRKLLVYNRSRKVKLNHLSIYRKENIMEYTVYAGHLEEVIKHLDRMAKKAAKYGVPFGYKVGEEHPQTVNVYAVDPADGHTQYVERKYKVGAVDIEVDCDALIKQDGWTVLAHIEHGDNGNIVTSIGGAEIDNAWYTAPARCDHCNTNRNRAVTFMVKNKDGEIRQVGNTCLKEYTGIDHRVALMWAEVRDLFPQDFFVSESEFNEMRSARVFDVELILAHAVDAIKAKGYIKADDRDSTRDQVAKLLREDAIPSAEGKAKAKQIVEWLVTECADTIGIERDCFVLAQSGWAKRRHIGRLAYMPVAYDKAMERKAREEARAAGKAAEAERSGYVGKVGERVQFEIASAVCVSSWDTDYGKTYLQKFTDKDGNVFIWKTGNFVIPDYEVGVIYSGKTEKLVSLKGTVKEHSEYDGVKQTVLTRCKGIYEEHRKA